MKKLGFMVVIIGILSAFFALGASAEDAALKVTAMSGKVLVKVYPSDQWTALAMGQMVHSKDAVSTLPCDPHKENKLYVDANGQMCPQCGGVTLELTDKSSISLKPGAEATIDEIVLTNAARKLKVDMAQGELRMIIAQVNTPSEFSVKTPNAIYGATGTVFYVKADATGTSVYVSDGSLNVFNPIDGKTYTVTAGTIMTFNVDGTFTGPAPASGVDVTGWTANYTSTTAEPYTPPMANRPNVEPPENNAERPASGG